ncbi:MAG: hypothetical protein DIZ80_00545 [endosymbiont of Galathealinum brachiosum]|uniref:PilZ domain-containing protein n=1 Tax=endosymbiont of Galathealinum brachiosum TaxID=2200906 RepID=A0A370DM47_9GAMM|nr:MAG: hypothetical protein DIZ80_00545 [endosymbiont of Galathealinum brachiosum]
MKEFNQRAHARVSYPTADRPSLVFDIESYDVVDISKYGLKVFTDNDLAFLKNDSVIALIVFLDGREFNLTGHVVRLGHNYAGLQLDTPLPLDVIEAEAMH